MNPNILALSARAMVAAALSGSDKMYRGHHAGGRIHEQFDLGSIMKARRNNQRAKNQKRLRGMGK
jgi:hypothetical protein